VALPLARLLLPPEPPEKWKTIRAALCSKEKTRRLCLILLVGSIPVIVVAAALVVILPASHRL
jgi:hypothetical protein